MNSLPSLRAATEHKLLKPALGAALTVLCGLALWMLPLGEGWVNASYDYLFRFGAHSVTDKVVIILMDNTAYDLLHQVRGGPWDRALHTALLNQLSADGCRLVVFGTFFSRPGDQAKDEALAAAMRRQRCITLMAGLSDMTPHARNVDSVRPMLPAELFLSAANSNWGVAWCEPDFDSIVRHHWPFPAPGPYDSLPRSAARLLGARLGKAPREQWLRYYGQNGAWTSLSYHLARNQVPNYFRDKIVFIGNKPETPLPDGEQDEFRTPYTRWTKEAVGGVELIATSFLNLMNGDWLRRAPWWLEALVLVVTGLLLGGGLCQTRPLAASALAAGAGFAVTFGAVALSYFSNYWFPWLVIAGGQVPIALACALLASQVRRRPKPATEKPRELTV